MTVDFDKFDKMVDEKQLKKDIEAASMTAYDEVPDGTYVVSIETLEVKPTKAGDKLMLSAAFKINETIDAPMKQDGRWVFFNRVICGNRTTENWNDGKAIKGVITWLKEIFDDVDIDFETYSQFANDVNSLYCENKDEIELQIKYTANAFNPIIIEDVFDAN